MLTLAAIREAQARLAGEVVRTPLRYAPTLSAQLGCELWFKHEQFQLTASFKERGAFNKLSQLTPDEKARGVITMSAGNHAQAVAYHAQRMGLHAVVVMPRLTPSVKVDNTRRFGAEVVLEGEHFDDARRVAMELAQQRALTLVHPFDDEAVMAGQGTVALEMLEQQPELDLICVPVGGGGLISGMAVAIKALRPEIEVIGVQAERCPAAYGVFKACEVPPATSTIAEGIAVKARGTLTTPLMRAHVDDMLLVGETDIERAMVFLVEVEKVVAEGAGAGALAAILRHPERFAGRRVGVVLSGGNVDSLTLASVLHRSLVRSHRLVRLRVEARDIPGALARMTDVFARHQANIEDVLHQRVFTDLPAQNVQIDFVVATRGRDHLTAILAALHEAGFDAEVVGA